MCRLRQSRHALIPKPHNPITLLPHNLGVLLVGSLDFNFLGFYMNYSKEAKSLTFRRGSEVGPVTLQPNNPITL